MKTVAPPIDLAYVDADPRAPILRRGLLALYIISGVIYFAWRVTVFNPDAMLISVIFYAVEFIGFLGSLLLFFVTMQRRARQPRRAPSGLRIDVFVTSRNEDIDVVRRTLVAATRIRYPHETWLLDDGNRVVFRQLAAELGCRYLTRADNLGAKAGNLNHALRHARGDFVAILDADHCAEPIFLDRLLGYFDDADVAIVQTPQDYFNLNSFQHGRDRSDKLIWHDQSGFHHVEQPGRDYHNAATLCGCSCVLRRSHIDLVGGFPTETVTEDMHIAVKLQKRGLKTVYHDEPLAFGIAPPDLHGFLLQRLRWGEGNMQVCRIERLPFAWHLTWRQNLSYLLLGFAYLDAWRKLVLYVAPIWTLLTDQPPVYGAPLGFLFVFLPFLCIGIITYTEFYSGFGRILKTEAYTMARLGAGLAATWGLFRRNIRFRISSKSLVGRATYLLALPQAVIFFGGLFAICYAATNQIEILAGRAWQSIPPEIVAVLCILVAYHCVLAFGVLREVLRSARTNEKNYRFDVCLPIRLAQPEAHPIAWTQLISIDGARARVVDAGLLDGRTMAVDIFIPAGRIRTQARVQALSADVIHLLFVWSSLAARDELDQALHAGRWHRIVNGKYEVGLTLLERLGLLTPPPTRSEAHVAWEPVLARPAGWPDDGRLAYLKHGGHSADPTETIFFGPVYTGFYVVAARVPGWLGRYRNLGPLRLHSLLDENALESFGGYRNCVERGEFDAPLEDLVPVSAAE